MEPPKPRPLPRATEEQVHPDLHKVDSNEWVRLLAAEEWTNPSWNSEHDATSYSLHIGILGWLYISCHADHVTETLGYISVRKIEEAVQSCNDHEELGELGGRYRQNLILPTPSGNLTPPSSALAFWACNPHSLKDTCTGKAITDVSSVSDKEISMHQVTKAQALERDGQRCVVTGFPDTSQFSHAKRENTKPEGCYLPSHCCYILPPALIRHPSTSELFDLNQRAVYHLCNTLTLSDLCMDGFDRLWIWFEATKLENQYTVRSKWPMEPYTDRQVIFTDHSGQGLAMPDPRFLAVHEVVCRTLCESRADAWQEFWDERKIAKHVLHAEGSDDSAFILSEALNRILRTVSRGGDSLGNPS